MAQDQHPLPRAGPPSGDVGTCVDADAHVDAGTYVDAELAMAETVIEVRELLAALDPSVEVLAELDEEAPDVWALNVVTDDGAVLSGVFTAHLPPQDAEWLVVLRPAGRGPEATVSRPMRTPEVVDAVRGLVAEARRRRDVAARAE